MSFQKKSFWVPRDAGFTTNGEMNFENSSKTEPKRGHQWLMDGTSPELFSNKRQATETESIKENAIPDVSPIGVSSWDNNANIQTISGPFTDRLFGSQSIHSSTLVDRNIAPFSAGDAKYMENQFANGSSSMSLSMSHGIDDPSSFFNYAGLRKVRINQVREQEKSIPSPMESFYRRGNDGAITVDSHYSKTDASMISLGPSHPDMNESSVSMATGYSKGDESFNFMGQNYNNHASFIPMGHSYRVAENFIPMNPLHKDTDDSLSIGHSFDKVDANSVHIDPTPTYAKDDSGILSMGHIGNGAGNALCFGGFHDGTEANVSGAMIGNYELVLDAEGSVQASEVQNQKTLAVSNADNNPNPIVYTTSSNSNVNSRADNLTKNKDPKTAKKPPANNFPSNVKSLLSTGILDGVPVKYVSWSREKNMKGIIKGTGYLCGCSDCNHTKSLNAYEFERHADCKTKHPNNHIYFDNGKTIYAVVQELKNTPQEMLFDAIETVTGSAINQKNFRAWKASYQAATRELQRIYGKDEVKLPC